MKKVLLFTLLTCLLALSSNNVFAQIKTPQPSPTLKMETTVGLTDLTIEYSRPSVKGRTIFANDGLVPFGKTWRTGANASTKVNFSSDVTIAGKELKKGKYALYTVPNADQWEVIFYNNTSHWGTPKEWNTADEALRITVKTESLSRKVETFTIEVMDNTINSANIVLAWDKTMIAIPVKAEVDQKVMKSIDVAMQGTSRGEYYTAARYYYDNGKDLSKALDWIKSANKIDAKFWQLRLQSLIEAKLGDTKSAIQSANESIKLAKEAGNMDYVRMNEKSIQEWSK